MDQRAAGVAEAISAGELIICRCHGGLQVRQARPGQQFTRHAGRDLLLLLSGTARPQSTRAPAWSAVPHVTLASAVCDACNYTNG